MGGPRERPESSQSKLVSIKCIRNHQLSATLPSLNVYVHIILGMMLEELLAMNPPIGQTLGWLGLA
jgi:hypothetical protein